MSSQKPYLVSLMPESKNVYTKLEYCSYFSYFVTLQLSTLPGDFSVHTMAFGTSIYCPITCMMGQFCIRSAWWHQHLWHRWLWSHYQMSSNHFVLPEVKWRERKVCGNIGWVHRKRPERRPLPLSPLTSGPTTSLGYLTWCGQGSFPANRPTEYSSTMLVEMAVYIPKSGITGHDLKQ